MFEIMAMFEPAGLEETVGTFSNSDEYLRISFPIRDGFRCFPETLCAGRVA